MARLVYYSYNMFPKPSHLLVFLLFFEHSFFIFVILFYPTGLLYVKEDPAAGPLRKVSIF